jgi:glycosyltransferase involved in cell wall biosynthesis
MSRPLVVQVVPYYPPHLGGMENVAKAIAEVLARSRPVEVITTTCGAKRCPRVERQGTLTVRRLRACEISHLPVAPGLLLRMLRVPRRAVVHVHIAQALVPEMVWFSRWLRGGSFVAHFHLDVNPSGRFGRVFSWYKKRVLGHTLRAAAKVIALSEDQAAFIERTYRVDPGAISVLPNGVGPEFTPAPAPDGADGGAAGDGERPLRVLYVGRLSQQKALPRLVRALAVMRQPVQAVLVGEGDSRPAIEELLREYSLTNVRLAGARRGADLVNSYRWADVLVLPSDKEGMPLVVLEAMASGLPVVATDVAGTRELLGDAGVLVPPDPDSIARALDRVAADATLRAELSARGLAAARDYSWERLAHRLESLYEEAARW